MLDVYSISNALVDLEYEIPERALEELGVKKGSSIILNRLEFMLIKQKITSHFTLRGTMPAGSVYNSMAALRSLGGNVYMSFSLSQDNEGEAYLRKLNAAKMGHIYENRPLKKGETGQCLVLITPDCERTMITYLGCNSELSTLDLNEAKIIRARYLFIEGYLVADDQTYKTILAAIGIAVKNKVSIALTLSDASLIRNFHERFRHIIETSNINLIFANASELCAYTEQTDLTCAVVSIQKYVKKFSVTRGSDGAFLFDGKHFYHIPAFPAYEHSSVGAGDIFAGTLFYGITHGFPWSTAGYLASKMAALVVSQYGPALEPELVQTALKHVTHEAYE